AGRGPGRRPATPKAAPPPPPAPATAAPASGSRRAAPRNLIAKAYADSPGAVHSPPRGEAGVAPGCPAGRVPGARTGSAVAQGRWVEAERELEAVGGQQVGVGQQRRRGGG